jgi:PAS domain S-box-containing protein
MFNELTSNKMNCFSLTPLTIIIAYVIFGSLWITIMTFVLLHVKHDMSSLAYLESLGDWLFVLLTALLLYLLIKRLTATVQQSNLQYRELVEFLPLAIGLYVGDRLVYANAAGLKLLEKSSLGDISKVPLFEMLTTDNILATQTRIREIEQGRSVPFEERQLRLSDGSTLVAEVAGIPFSHRGKPAALLVAHDITVRKQLEDERIRMYEELENRVKERTRELERRQRVAEGLRGVIAKLNSNSTLDEIMDYVVAQTAHALGSTAGAIYRLDDLGEALAIQTAVGLPRAFVESIRIPLGQTILGQAVALRQPMSLLNIQTTVEEKTLPGEVLSLAEMLANDYHSVLAVPLVVKDSVYGGLVLYFPDMRKFSADDIEIAIVFSDQIALAIENASLLVEVEETSALTERNRLAQDLHDSVSQVLFSASLIAEVLPQIWEIDQSEGLKRLHELRQLTRGAMAEMRILLHELRPDALEEAPLPELLRHLVEATIGRASIPIELVIDGQVDLPTQARIGLYRITQQALDNIFRHARASHAAVSLNVKPGYIELQIKDDGCGFDPAQVIPGHFGLKIMRERAEAINASLAVQSNIEDGTSITVHCII